MFPYATGLFMYLLKKLPQNTLSRSIKADLIQNTILFFAYLTTSNFHEKTMKVSALMN